VERLQKVLAAHGVASRRKAEELILAGRVQVDGKIVKELGVRVSANSQIEVDGKGLSDEPLTYLLLHKPPGYVTTVHDPQGRPTVLELVRSPFRLYPVGRLDYDSEGLLLLTNDGELANMLTHPRFGIEKTYRATVQGIPSAASIERLARGVRLEDGLTQPADVRLVAERGEHAVLELTIHEGRKRQVRRMCQAVGHKVIKLVRIRFGPLVLGALPPGATRSLFSQEKKSLEKLREVGRKKRQSKGHTTDGGGGRNDYGQKRR
jgi:pseudouridine synthase